VILAAITLGLSLLALTLAIINALTIFRPGDRAGDPDFSILLPLRNEASNIEDLFANLRQVKGVREIIALDDNSTDKTREILERERFESVKILDGSPLPQGWLGKIYALDQLYRSGSGKYLVFIDGDVRLHPEGISRAISRMERQSWDFISPYPRQIALTFLERIIQPLLQWSWFASVPLRLGARIRKPAMAIANGQFFIVTKAALEHIDGFVQIKNEILDDLELARALWRSGAKGSVIEGSSLAYCRMYQSGSELINGYSKSLWRAFGSPFGAFIASLLLLATSWLPILLILSTDSQIAASGWIAFFAITISRLIAALVTKSFWQSALLHPISVIVLLYILLRSFYLKRKGALTWRDRVVA
jgi:glycosyltransferase involved in cell wall biosynthesis